MEACHPAESPPRSLGRPFTALPGSEGCPPPTATQEGGWVACLGPHKLMAEPGYESFLL